MKNRIIYFDFIRVFAIIGVITIHVTAPPLYIEPVGTFNWVILNSYNMAVGGGSSTIYNDQWGNMAF